MNEVETIRFPVAGMTCTSCVNRITRSLRKVDGVSSVKLDLRSETATVGHDPSRVDRASLVAAVADAGYQADLDAAVVVLAAESRGLVERLIGRSRRMKGDRG